MKTDGGIKGPGSAQKRGLRIKMARTRLGDILVARGRISERELDRALEQQRITGTKIGHILLQQKRISRLDLLTTLSQQISTRAVLTIFGLCLALGGSGIGAARAQNEGSYSYPATQVAFNAAPPRAQLAQRPQGLFGKSEVLSTNMSAFTKWTGVLARMQDRSNSKSALEAAYAKYGLGSLTELSKAPLAERIAHINTVVNRIPYKEDKDSWGKSDYWATPKETAARNNADCEDYAIAKYALLKATGVPENMIRIAIVRDQQKNIPHAILVVYDQNGPEILDNQSQYVRQASAISWYAPLYSINAQAWWRHI